MNKTTRIIIVLTVVAVAVLALLAKQNKSTSPAVPVGAHAMAATADSPSANAIAGPAAVGKAKRPRLVDLGAGQCIPCKLMKPILDDLKANYADHFSTEFIDVWENPDAGKQYGIEVIPTQIFYNAEGKEL
jgi:thioredoxin 1